MTISILLDTPSLRLRKDIWTQFPVCLIRLPQSEDCRDRYAVQWHHKNLDTWCQNIPQYHELVRMRLLKALAESDRWSIEPPATRGDICIIAMKFSQEPRKYNSLPNINAPLIRIRKVEDLRTFFPICWKSRKNMHTLEFHNTFVRAIAEKQGIDEVDVRRITLERMLPVLRADWIVNMSMKLSSSEICTIHK